MGGRDEFFSAVAEDVRFGHGGRGGGEKGVGDS